MAHQYVQAVTAPKSRFVLALCIKWQQASCKMKQRGVLNSHKNLMKKRQSLVRALPVLVPVGEGM
jgi:hypothetical protein